MKNSMLSLFLAVQVMVFVGNSNAEDLGIPLNRSALLSADQGTVFLANSEARIQAHDAQSGSMRWRSVERGLPLAVWKNQILVVSDELARESLLLLNAQDGSITARAELELPNEVHWDVQPSAGRHTEWRVLPDSATNDSHESVYVLWSFQARNIRGAQSLDESQTALNGSLRLHFDPTQKSLTVDSVSELDSIAATSQNFRINLSASEKPAGSAAEIYRSLDDRSRMRSTFLAQRSANGSYGWQISSVSGETLGTLTVPFEVLPFVENGVNAFMVQSPHSEMLDGTYVMHPERIVAYALSSGLESWSVAILPSQFRGVLPP